NKHQRTLLMRDIDAALATISAFESLLKEHIAYEDEVLLPLFAAKEAQTEGATLPLFHAEHRKLRDMAANLSAKTEALYDCSDLLESILTLLDEESLFKGLFAHHALREKNLFFPRLDACTTEWERQRALSARV